MSKPSPSGHTEGNCRTGQTLKKPKYLSVCDREERRGGEGAVCMCDEEYRDGEGAGWLELSRFYLFIYYESTKRKLKTKYTCECRCYERLHTKTKVSWSWNWNT